MISLMRGLISPMTSLFFLAIGAGLITTVQSVYLEQQHHSTFMIAITVASFYLGFVYAAFKCESIIRRIYHIRAYSFFAAILSAITILQFLVSNIWLWILLRLVAGYATAGLYVVIESWLLCKSTTETRGRVLAIYMVVFYAAQSLSQLFLKIEANTLMECFLYSTLFTVLSIIPLSVTKTPQPEFMKPSVINVATLFKATPSGVLSCIVAGLILGPIYGLLPSYLSKMNDDPSFIAFSMAILILGGMTFQYPLGRLSDSFDRRKVLGWIFIMLSVITMFMIVGSYSNNYLYIILFLFGGAAFAIYPIGISHASEALEVGDMVAAVQSLVLYNSLGMVIGPLMASMLPTFFPQYEKAFLWYFVGISIMMFIFFFWRGLTKDEPPESEHADFVVMPRATPLTVEIDPRIEDEQ